MEIDQYLKQNGWYNIYDNKWADLTLRCRFTEVHEEVAFEIQRQRDRLAAMPWYKRLASKIFDLRLEQNGN